MGKLNNFVIENLRGPFKIYIEFSYRDRLES